MSGRGRHYIAARLEEDDNENENTSAWLRFRYRVETIFLRSLAGAVSLFPRPLVLGLAERLGVLA